jgi:hypothetical protein
VYSDDNRITENKKNHVHINKTVCREGEYARHMYYRIFLRVFFSFIVNSSATKVKYMLESRAPHKSQAKVPTMNAGLYRRGKNSLMQKDETYLI